MEKMDNNLNDGPISGSGTRPLEEVSAAEVSAAEVSERSL